MERIKRFLKEEEGVTMIEYGLLAALVAVALITVLGNLKTGLNTMFQNVASNVSGSGTGS